MKRIYLLTIFTIVLFSKEKALVISEVADLLAGPETDDLLKHGLPIAPIDFKDGISCPRVHQALANEIVEVLETQKNGSIVSISNAFYQSKLDGSKNTSYWINNKHIIPLRKLKQSNVNLSLIPKPIDFRKPNKKQENVIVLMEPFFDKKTNRTFSVGTRFVTSNGKAQIFNPSSLSFYEIAIPQKYYLEEKARSKNDAIDLFCKLLEEWTEKKYIPYVWGGASLTKTCGKKFKEKIIGKRNFYEIEGYNQKIKTGFDCSNLILRAAQIVGLPFYYKNTYTMAENLTPINPEENIPKCALIIWPGHVIVLTNTKAGTIVEAGDYLYGWGRLHKVQLPDFFKDISSIQDLQKACTKKEPLLRLNPNKEVVQKINNFKFYLL